MINILVLIIFFFSRTNIVTLGSKIQKPCNFFQIAWLEMSYIIDNVYVKTNYSFFSSSMLGGT